MPLTLNRFKLIDFMNLTLRGIVSKKGAVANLSSFKRKNSLFYSFFFLNLQAKYAYRPNFIKKGSILG